MLTENELKRTVLRSNLFLAYADGSYGDIERRVIAEMADGLDVSEDDRGVLTDDVQEHRMSQQVPADRLESLTNSAKALD